MLKKIGILCLAAAIALSASACSKGASGKSNSSSSAAASSAVPGPAASGAASQALSQAITSANQPGDDADYTVKTEEYQGGENIAASYPQLSKSGTDFSAVNALLKKTCLQSINDQKASLTQAVVQGHVGFQGKEFLSVLFTESYTASGVAHTGVRSVNYDLKSGKQVAWTDLLAQNDAFSAALLKAAQARAGKSKSSVTADVVKQGLSSGCVAFTRTGVSFYLIVPHSLGDLILASVKYQDTAAFRTKSTLWSNFLST